jgi:stage III sporulation protein AC
MEITMEVDLIFQIAGIGIVVAVINQLLSRAGRDEQALLVTIAGLVVVLFILTERIGQLFMQIKQIFNL